MWNKVNQIDLIAYVFFVSTKLIVFKLFTTNLNCTKTTVHGRCRCWNQSNFFFYSPFCFLTKNKDTRKCKVLVLGCAFLWLKVRGNVGFWWVKCPKKYKIKVSERCYLHCIGLCDNCVWASRGLRNKSKSAFCEIQALWNF